MLQYRQAEPDTDESTLHLNGGLSHEVAHVRHETASDEAYSPSSE